MKLLVLFVVPPALAAATFVLFTRARTRSTLYSGAGLLTAILLLSLYWVTQ